jgi:ATP-dependent Clp protease ATP-binding subunit ClpA
MRTIDTKRRSQQVLDLQKKFASRIVGQEEATEAITNCLEKYLGGLADNTRPIASLLFLGPTGTGKTSVVEALCEGLYGSSTMMVRIDCAEFQYGHEIAKLIGSPPGYLGHKETPAVLTMKSLLEKQTMETPFTVVLFDEIEKASDELWHLLLGVLDKGRLTLGDNSVTNFTRCIIIMTSNVGARTLATAAGEGGLGFQSLLHEHMTPKEVKEISMSAARRKFTPEFLNRLDEIVTFNTLTKDQIEEVMGMELAKIQKTYIAKTGSQLHVSPAALDELLLRGYDKKYNARGIKRTLEKEIMTPIARALSCYEAKFGDTIVIDYTDDGEFKFYVLGKVPDGANGDVTESVLPSGQLSLPIL